MRNESLSRSLKDKVILVSGATSGIGRGAVLDLASRGARVYAGTRAAAAGRELESLAASGGHGSLTAISLDVTDSSQTARAIATVLEREGRIDALVNNAGLAIPGPVEALRLEDYRTQLDVNFFGAVALTQVALPHLRASRGRIVMVSSVNGRLASPFLSAYAASKFALEGFSDSLRRELAPLGVSVSIIEPGPVKTAIWEKSFHTADQIEQSLSQNLKHVYAKSLSVFRKAVEKAADGARPVEDVTACLRDALAAQRPKARYVVGGENKLTMALNSVLPDSVVDALIRKTFR